MIKRERVIATEEAFAVADVEAERGRTGSAPRALLAELLDVGEGRLATMDAAGVDVQVLSLASPGVQDLDDDPAVALAAVANDRLAAAIAAHPTRFAGLAAVAPQVPDAAATELERAVRKLGLNGVLINSHTRGEYLDDARYWPILQAAEALNVPLYLHPRDPGSTLAGPALNVPGFRVGWGFTVETGTHALRLISAGVFDRFPRLQIVLGHLGEALPFLIHRLDERFSFERKANPKIRAKRFPSEYLRENFHYTTSGMNTAAPVQAVIELVGLERLMFAVDYPFEDQRAAVDGLRRMPLTDVARRTIMETNALRVFGFRH